MDFSFRSFFYVKGKLQEMTNQRFLEVGQKKLGSSSIEILTFRKRHCSRMNRSYEAHQNVIKSGTARWVMVDFTEVASKFQLGNF